MHRATLLLLTICLSFSAAIAQKQQDSKSESAEFVKKEFRDKDVLVEKKKPFEKDKYKKVSKPKKKKKGSKDYEVMITHNTQSLTRNLGIWRTTDLRVQKKFSDGKIVWGGFRNSQRKSVFDQQVIGGIYKPITKKWSVTAEGQYSLTNNFVGKVNLLGKVEKIFKKGWIGHAGVRFRLYDDVKVITQFTTAERYWGNNLAGYTLNLTKLSTGGTAPSHRVHYSRYYGERINSIGFAVSAGKEVENLAGNLGVLRTNVLSVSTSIRHWITDNFGIIIDANLHKQGNLYYRRGLNFGVRYRF
jgi:YaiO family outer membrane protein